MKKLLTLTLLYLLLVSCEKGNDTTSFCNFSNNSTTTKAHQNDEAIRYAVTREDLIAYISFIYFGMNWGWNGSGDDIWCIKDGSWSIGGMNYSSASNEMLIIEQE